MAGANENIVTHITVVVVEKLSGEVVEFLVLILIPKLSPAIK